MNNQLLKKLQKIIEDFSKTQIGKLTISLLVILGFAIIPIVIHSNYIIRIIVTAGIYAIMAIGLNIILGYTGLLNLGYAAYFAVGAYMWALLASPKFNLHWPFLVVFLLAGLTAGILGFLLAIPGLKLKGDYLALVTIGFGESIRILANNMSFTNGAMGIMQIDPIKIGPFTAESVQNYYYLLLIIITILVILVRRLENSRIGNAWMAVREDELAAECMGMPTRNLKLLACFMGAIPAGMAGVFFAAMETYVSPVSFKFIESITVIAMVVVGGRANVYGAVLGALLLTILPEPLRGSSFDTARILVYGLMLTLMMLLRPQGFWPRRYKGEREKPQIEEKSNLDNSSKSTESKEV